MGLKEKPIDLLFYCPHWGQEHLPFTAFLQRVKEEGYDGVEMSLPPDEREATSISSAIAAHGLLFVGQHWDTVTSNYAQHLEEYEQRLRSMADTGPLYITSHTGKDFFTFEQNTQLILLADRIAAEKGVRIIHETHRGKFSFAAHITSKYLEQIPELRLNLDISHWFNVAESFLQDQPESVSLATERTEHIHARVGYTQGPQVNDPRAPEWDFALQQHLVQWDKVITMKRLQGVLQFGITCEFGPPPYMPCVPFTGQPVADQWTINAYMMNLLKERYKQ